MAEKRIDHLQQPPHLAERNVGTLLAGDLDEPFLGDTLEGDVLVDLRAELATLLLDGRIDAVGQHLASGIAPGACVGEAHLRPDAEREGLVLAEPAIAQPPVFCAVGHDEEEQGALVGELVGLRSRRGVTDRECGKAHGVSPSKNGWIGGRNIPTKVRVYGRTHPNHVGQDIGKRPLAPATYATSVYVTGLEKWCPEEESCKVGRRCCRAERQVGSAPPVCRPAEDLKRASNHRGVERSQHAYRTAPMSLSSDYAWSCA